MLRTMPPLNSQPHFVCCCHPHWILCSVMIIINRSAQNPGQLFASPIYSSCPYQRGLLSQHRSIRGEWHSSMVHPFLHHPFHYIMTYLHASTVVGYVSWNSYHPWISKFNFLHSCPDSRPSTSPFYLDNQLNSNNKGWLTLQGYLLSLLTVSFSVHAPPKLTSLSLYNWHTCHLYHIIPNPSSHSCSTSCCPCSWTMLQAHSHSPLAGVTHRMPSPYLSKLWDSMHSLSSPCTVMNQWVPGSDHPLSV